MRRLATGQSVCFASGQQDGDETSLSICECVNLRVAPSARTANSLLLLPPFPPAAERCALTWVESIICVSADRPFPASSRNRFSQMPRRRPAHEAVIDRRRWTIGFRQSHQRQPLLSTWTMPLMTRRSSTRSTPRTSFGNRGSIRAYCFSFNQNKFLLIFLPQYESAPYCRSRKINEFSP